MSLRDHDSACVAGLSLLFEQGFLAPCLAPHRLSPTPHGAYSDYALIDVLPYATEQSAVFTSLHEEPSPPQRHNHHQFKTTRCLQRGHNEGLKAEIDAFIAARGKGSAPPPTSSSIPPAIRAILTRGCDSTTRYCYCPVRGCLC